MSTKTKKPKITKPQKVLPMLAQVTAKDLANAVKCAIIAKGKVDKFPIQIHAQADGKVRVIGTNGHWSSIYTVPTTSPVGGEFLVTVSDDHAKTLSNRKDEQAVVITDTTVDGTVSTLAKNESIIQQLQAMAGLTSKPSGPHTGFDSAYLEDISKAFKIAAGKSVALRFDFGGYLKVTKVTNALESESPLTVFLMPVETLPAPDATAKTRLEDRINAFAEQDIHVGDLKKCYVLMGEATLLREILNCTSQAVEQKVEKISDAMKRAVG